MAIPPLVALGSAIGAGAAAGSAVRTAGSGFASMLRAALGSGNAPAKPQPIAAPAEASAADPPPWERMRAAHERDVADFGRDLAALLAAKGIDSGNGLSLSLDALGKVRVLGDHPEKSNIEALFAADGELADRFRELATRAETLKAASSAANDGLPAPSPPGLDFGRFVLHLDRGGARHDLTANLPAIRNTIFES